MVIEKNNTNKSSIEIYELDKDKEIGIEITNKYSECALIYLDKEEVLSIINFLQNQINLC